MPISAHAAGVSSAVPGIYMTSAYIPDNHEGFMMGAPEFEVHVFRQNSAGTFVDIICSGNEQGSPYYYDHNDAMWSGEVLLITEADLGEAEIEIHVWEDDTDACKPSSGRPPNTTSAQLDDIRDFALATVALREVVILGNTLKTLAAIVVYVPVAIDFLASFHKDDLVGLMEGPPGGCWPEGTDPVTFAIQHTDGTARGNATLDFRLADERTPVCETPPPPPPDWSVQISGPNPINPTSTCGWEAAIGGSGSPAWPVTYYWLRNGAPAGTDNVYYGGMDGASSFTLSVWVTDATGTGRYAETTITGDESVWEECLM